LLVKEPFLRFAKVADFLLSKFLHPCLLLLLVFVFVLLVGREYLHHDFVEDITKDLYLVLIANRHSYKLGFFLSSVFNADVVDTSCRVQITYNLFFYRIFSLYLLFLQYLFTGQKRQLFTEVLGQNLNVPLAPVLFEM
jgi:hypothetical protein